MEQGDFELAWEDFRMASGSPKGYTNALGEIIVV
jgi:hypothetical protein